MVSVFPQNSITFQFSPNPHSPIHPATNSSLRSETNPFSRSESPSNRSPQFWFLLEFSALPGDLGFWVRNVLWCGGVGSMANPCTNCVPSMPLLPHSGPLLVHSRRHARATL
uniref:Uncharacterized protein MANES_04G123000 n=1 Tax=Rhizophora mucronata TaxID=61149 RepID=A0A2P2JD18_RHIMU